MWRLCTCIKRNAFLACTSRRDVSGGRRMLDMYPNPLSYRQAAGWEYQPISPIWHGSRLPLYKSVPITFPLPRTSGIRISASWQTALVLPGERSRRLLLPSLHGWGSVTLYELGEAVQLAELGLVGSLHISWFHVKLNHYTHTHTLADPSKDKVQGILVV